MTTTWPGSTATKQLPSTHMSMSITIMIMAGTNTSTATSMTMRATPMSTRITITPTTIITAR